MGVTQYLISQGVDPATLYDVPGSEEYLRLQEAARQAEAERQRIAAEEAARIAAEEQARLLAEKNYQLMLQEQERQRLAELAAQEALFQAAPEPLTETPPLMVIQPAIPFQDMPVIVPENNATPVSLNTQPLPQVEPVTVLSEPAAMVTNPDTGEQGVYLESGQFISESELNNLKAENIVIPEEQVTNIPPVVPQEIIVNPEPQPAVQYIGEEEQQALKDEGITLPTNDPTVVLVPVNEITQPVLFDTVVTIKEKLPDIPVEDITSIVIQEATSQAEGTNIDVQVNIPVLIDVVGEVEAEKIVTDIQNNVPLTDETAKIIVENNAVTEKYKEPIPNGTDLLTGTPADLDYLKRNPDVQDAVTKGDFINGFHHYQNYGKAEFESGEVWSKKREYKFFLNYKKAATVKNLSLLDQLTEYVYKLIYK